MSLAFLAHDFASRSSELGYESAAPHSVLGCGNGSREPLKGGSAASPPLSGGRLSHAKAIIEKR